MINIDLKRLNSLPLFGTDIEKLSQLRNSFIFYKDNLPELLLRLIKYELLRKSILNDENIDYDTKLNINIETLVLVAVIYKFKSNEYDIIKENLEYYLEKTSS